MKGIFENVVADSNGKGRDPSWSARGMDSTRPVISERACHHKGEGLLGRII